MEQRFSDNETSKRDIPSFIEPRPPLINNPFMRPRPEKGRNLLELFEEDSEFEEPELVQVYLRVKPCQAPNNLYELRSDKCLVTSLDTATATHGRRTQHNVSRMYKFSHIFNAKCSQKEIFDRVVKENLKKLPDGHSFTLLAYGASGSGKTYTLMGTVNSPGLIPRSLEYVFKLVYASHQPIYKPTDGESEKLDCYQQEFELQWVKRLRQVSVPHREKYRRMSAQLTSDLTTSTFDLTNKTKYYVWVSFVEIYNEAIYDLLAPPDKRTKLRIREDTTGQVYVKGVTQAFVRTSVEAYDVMVAGKHNLVVAETGIHAQSSRSHCIFTITMLSETDGEIRSSCIRLCDLAGCERARSTHNIGTRMKESRAINSSLHVLERCLHMLRRNQKQRQEAMVPYRESKLTRLLGSGLSGSRGEAVSMVVTLNPAPQYAQETKHVLSLAAVAQDIQINNTAMFASAYETTQDTTVSNNSTEVVKLRADNELLHFELVQAQHRNKELLAAMEEKLEDSANTMREMVEEAKDMTKQYYESQIDALKSEMEDMIEEYEARLSQTAPPAAVTGTPTRFLQTKIAYLMTEIAVLEDKLSAERLARARAEEEVKHLRTCIDERDEKVYTEVIPEKQKDVLVLTDSDDESSDPFNESLEPVFKKSYLNRSQAIKTSKQLQKMKNKKENDDENPTFIEVEESDFDKSTESIKQVDGDDDSTKNSEYVTGDDSEVKEQTRDSIIFTISNEKNVSTAIISMNTENRIDDQSYSATNNVNNLVEANKPDIRGTYFVQDTEQYNGPNESVEIKSNIRGTYFVSRSLDSSSDEEIENAVNEEENSLSLSEKARGTYFVRNSAVDTDSDDGIEYPVNTHETETSCNKLENARQTHFVRHSNINASSGDGVQYAVNTQETETSCNELENARQTHFVRHSNINASSDDGVQYAVNTQETETSCNELEHARQTHFVRHSNINASSDDGVEYAVNTQETETSCNELENARQTHFVRHSNINARSDDGVEYAVNTQETETSSRDPEKSRATYFVRSSAIDTSIDEDMQEVVEHKTVPKEKRMETAPEEYKQSKKLSETLVSRIINSLKKSTLSNNSDSSLRQFEEIEIASQKRGNDSSEQSSAFGDIMFMKEKRSYFGENAESIADKLHVTAKKDASETFISSNKTKDSITDENCELHKSNAVPFCHNLERNIDFVENVHISKQATEHRTYFDNIEVSSEPIANKIVADIKTSSRKNHERSPSIVSDNIEPSEPSTMKKLLGENIAKLEVLSSIHHKALVKKRDSIDVFAGFESPLVKTKEKEVVVSPTTITSNIDKVRKSIEKLVLTQKTRDIKQGIILESNSSGNEDEIMHIKKIQIHEPVTIKKAQTVNENVNIVVTTELNETQMKDNTIQEFEKIYNDLSTRRPTEFDLLTITTQEIDANEKDEGKTETENKELSKTDRENVQKKQDETKTLENEEIKYYLRSKGKYVEQDETKTLENEEIKYYLRSKGKYVGKSVLNFCDEGKSNDDDEYLLNNIGKSVSKSKLNKRRLRLHRTKIQYEDNSDQDTEELKDILNLKKEFADVTLGLPAFKKEVKDIPSPEKLPDSNLPGEENLPPLLGIQSCPSKSVTRSRRKLFTPRADPLEESPSQLGDSAERVRVPRPSFHRARTRRKL